MIIALIQNSEELMSHLRHSNLHTGHTDNDARFILQLPASYITIYTRGKSKEIKEACNEQVRPHALASNQPCLWMRPQLSQT